MGTLLGSTGYSCRMDFFLTAFEADTVSCWTRADSSALPSASRFSCHRSPTKWSRSIFSWHSKHLRSIIYIRIASTGHSLTHAPHSMQPPTFALPSSAFIVSTGHTLSQLPQPISFVYLCGHFFLFLTGRKLLLAYAHNYNISVMGICQ